MTLMKRTAALLLLLSAALLSTGAQAYTAYTAKNVHLRAGPARDYPVVAILGVGLEVSVEGCLGDYTWCDVTAGSDHGWIYAGNLSMSYEGGYVPVLDYGAAIGVAVVSFILLDYWHSWYPARPWYRERDHWAHHPPPHRPPPHHPLAPPQPRPPHPPQPHRPHPPQPPHIVRPGHVPPAAPQRPAPLKVPRGEAPHPQPPGGPHPPKPQ